MKYFPNTLDSCITGEFWVGGKMDSKNENLMAIDTNTVANSIMRDITDIDAMEKMLSAELSSEDLFRIDCAILSSLRGTKDFSRDLLSQLEAGKFEAMVEKPEKVTPQKDMFMEVQRQTMADITQPLQNMFDEMANMVISKLS